MTINTHACKQIQFIIIVAMIIGFILGACNHGLIQSMEYARYRCNRSDYDIVSAQIIDIKKKDYLRRRDMAALSLVKTRICYSIGEKNYTGYIYSYPEMLDKKVINVGVNNKNAEKVIRCEPYIFTQKDKEIYMQYLMNTAMILLLFFFFNLFATKINERGKRKKEINEEHDCENASIKQNKILEYADSDIKRSETQCDLIKKTMENHGISCNSDCLWCLQHISCDKVMFLKVEQDFLFIKKTVELRQQGLPDEYCVIDQENGHYLCTRYGYKRIYCFSTNLGITNTTYEDVYDYILDKLDME